MSLKFLETTFGKIVAVVGGIGVVGGGVLAFDALYNNSHIEAALEKVETRVVEEIATNRSVMISILQGDADDIEFEILEIGRRGEVPPRYIQEKFKRITRTIEKLEQNEDLNQAPNQLA